MISKIGTSSFASALLLTSVAALPMDTGSLDQRTVLFDSAAGCARCIRGGYTFVYNALDSVTSSGEEIAAAGAYSAKNVCCNGLNCGDTNLNKQDGQLLSSDFASLDVALYNCPHKVDVCGTKKATIAAVDGKATLSVSTTNAMTQADSCHWEVKVTCGVPQVELTTLGGIFASATTAGLSYIEYKDLPNISSIPSVFDNQSDYAVGELFELMKGKYFGDVNAQGINLGAKGGILQPVPGFMVDKLVKEANAGVTAYLAAATKFTTDLAAYEANLVARAKKWIDIQFARPQTPPLDPLPVRFPYDADGKPIRPYPVSTEAPVPPELPELYTGLTGADAAFQGGYGSLTAGTITLKASDKKFFGVLGQGTGTNLGYMYPPEKSDACVAKYIGLSLYPIVADGATLATTSSDTFTATVTSTAAAVHDLDPTITADDQKDIEGGAKLAEQKKLLSDKFRAYDQWQYKNEYLGASTLAAGAIAATTLAGLALY